MKRNRPVHVYELTHEGKRVYIGITSNPAQRIETHSLFSNLLPHPLEMRILATCAARAEALEIEAALQLASGVQRRCQRGMKAAIARHLKTVRTQKKRRRPSMAWKPWSDAEDARLVTLIGRGSAVASIANELGRTPRAIEIRMERVMAGR